MKAYKGFSKDMTCRGFQFEKSKTYHEEEAELCQSGFHACEDPLDCLQYYPPATSIYREVELDEVSSQRENDSKVVGKTITIGAKVDFDGIVKASIEYRKERAEKAIAEGKTRKDVVGNCGCSTSGDCGCSTSGNYGCSTSKDSGCSTSRNYGCSTSGDGGCSTSGFSGCSTSRDCGCSTSGDYGCSTSRNCGCSASGDYGCSTSRGASQSGRDGVSVARGNGCKVRGGLGALLVIAEESDIDYNIEAWKAVVVDGEKIKADIWYKLQDGELVEVEANDGSI